MSRLTEYFKAFIEKYGDRWKNYVPKEGPNPIYTPKRTKLKGYMRNKR
jgi:hypothetical protein